MASYIIEGGNKLEGEVKIAGSKNSSLPILAASIFMEWGVGKVFSCHTDLLVSLVC